MQLISPETGLHVLAEQLLPEGHYSSFNLHCSWHDQCIVQEQLGHADYLMHRSTAAPLFDPAQRMIGTLTW